MQEPPERQFDMDGDATRRTLLASERTVLAWVRTGLTILALAIGIGRVVPGVAGGGHKWAYAALGTAYALVGVGVIMYGLWRGRDVDRAIRAGQWILLDDRFMWALGFVSVVLGLATAVLIVVDA
jgi:putative membrane protein